MLGNNLSRGRRYKKSGKREEGRRKDGRMDLEEGRTGDRGAKKRGRYRTTQIRDTLSHLLGSCTLSVFGQRSHDNMILPMDLGTHLGSSSE